MHRAVTLCLVLAIVSITAVAPAEGRESRTASLLSNEHLNAIVTEASGSRAKDTVIALSTMHRVQASSGFHDAAEYVAARARELGLSEVAIERFPADGKTTFGTFRSYFGWEAESGVLTETGPRARTVADYSTMRVALADYSNDADVTADLVDVGDGLADKDYAGREVKDRLVLAGGNVAGVHREAVEKRGAAGIVSYQQNQPSGWSGDYADNVRWGHLSPYNLQNRFAFMVSLREARELRSRLAGGESIRMRAVVRARMKPSHFEVVTATIPGSDPAAGEILYTCHLCHQKPGANDNASGAATILEDARLLARLIREGKLAQPRRTIRFLWPPEISGTACYLARHPEVASRTRAAIHMDMVGGDFERTKSVFHITRTPASLPSAVNDVAAVFGEHVIGASARFAAGERSVDAYVSPEGSKAQLVGEIAPHSMGSDHDVLQEGSYRIPTVYLNDWPDVFIHTDNDTPANIDSTKLRRVAIVGAATGYVLAAAGPDDAQDIALEVYARGAIRQGEALKRALEFGARGPVTVERFHDARNIVEQAGRIEREALLSILSLTSDSGSAARTIASLVSGVEARTRADVAVVQRYVPIPAAQTSEPAGANLVPKRAPTVVGPMSVYYYDYIEDKLGASPGGDGRIQYEILNLVDGRRSARAIREILAGAYGPVEVETVVEYLRVLEKAGVVRLE